MKIAIIGTGISGLAAAHRLHREHDLTLFEANDYVGGHTHTVEVTLAGRQFAVDTGFIVFNDWTYPNFIALLEELGVPSRPTEMSFSVRDDRSGLEYNGHNLDTLFAQRANLFRPRFHRMLWDIVKFNRLARAYAGNPHDETTVGEFLARHRLSRAFSEQYLLPMGAAIWSCPTGTFAQFPIRFIAEFYRNHGLLNLQDRPTWRYVVGGSRTYVRAITRDFADRIRLQSPIVNVQRREGRMLVQPRGEAAEEFDHVVFACHSDQALRMLGEDATRAEREVLSEFPYGRNVAVLHTDESVLPRRKKAWASWNYRLTGDDGAPASVTYNMNILQEIPAPETLCVTLNDETRIDPAKILGQFEYHHPVFTTRRAVAQARHPELLNAHGASYCGAYWGNGFHEDGVNSALAVVAALEGKREAGQPATTLAGSMSA